MRLQFTPPGPNATNRCRCDSPPALTTLGKALTVAIVLAGAGALAVADWWFGVDSTTAVWIAGLWASNRLRDL